jgi:hypothetical protein
MAVFANARIRIAAVNVGGVIIWYVYNMTANRYLRMKHSQPSMLKCEKSNICILNIFRSKYVK